MYVTDFKSSPFDIYNGGNNGNPNYLGTPTSPFNGYRGTGLNGIPDTSLDALLGSKWSTASGQTLTLVSNSANAQTSGHLMASSPEVTAFQKLAMTVPATYPATVGTFQILVTNGATVLNENLFAGGLAIVSAGTGIGQTLQIASHQPAANAGTFVVTLIDPIQVTLDATSKISLIANPAKNVVISPTTITGIPVGVTIYPVQASVASTFDATSGALTVPGIPQYFFVVSHGPVGCIIDSTVTTVGYPLGPSAATPGTLGIATLTASAQCAIAEQTLTSAQTGAVYLEL